VLDLSGLWVCRGDCLVTLEVMVDNSLPLRNETLTELRHASCGCVATFNPGERVFWSELFACRHVDTTAMRNATEIEVEHADRLRIQPFKRGCMAPKVSLLCVGLKCESTVGDAPSPE